MSEDRRHRRSGRSWRRVRRWARHTPNGEIALTMVCIGVALVFIAGIVAFAVL